MDDKAISGQVGYFLGIIIMVPFFWFTFGDAYGRFSIVFDPAHSTVGYEIQLITRRATGLVSFALPFLLAYLPRFTVAQCATALENMFCKFTLWTWRWSKKIAIFAKKWLVIGSRYGWNFLQKKLQEYQNK